MAVKNYLVAIKKGNEQVIVSPIIDYSVQYAKLWSSDTGRSMTGENKGTLIGIFPKITVKVGSQSEAARAKLLAAINQSSAQVEYFDTERKDWLTASFYFGDATSELKKQSTKASKPMSFSIIANQKRS